MAIRTFAAIESPSWLRDALTDIQETMIASGADVRWEPAEKFHATLKFFGGVEEAALPAVIAKMGSLLEQYGEIPIAYDHIGYFPRKSHPQIVWIGEREPHEHLRKLKAELDNEFASMGFSKEKRLFRPHVTLGRVRSGRGIKHLISTVENINFEPFTFPATEIVLMKSTLNPNGSTYSPLQKFELRKT
jgi:2'-5' RNA ligase